MVFQSRAGVADCQDDARVGEVVVGGDSDVPGALRLGRKGGKLEPAEDGDALPG